MKPKTKSSSINKEHSVVLDRKTSQNNNKFKQQQQHPLFKRDSNTSQKQLTNIIQNNAKCSSTTSSSPTCSSSVSKQQQQQQQQQQNSQATSKRIKEEKFNVELRTATNKSQQRLFVCSGCNRPILRDKFLLKACEKYWHENCLKCDHCNGRLGELGSTLYCKSDMNLCRHDYLKLFGKTGVCSVCEKLISATEMAMKAKQNVYHLECFACQLCNQRFCVGDRFYLCENKVVCQYDYEEHILPIQRSLFEQQQTSQAAYCIQHQQQQQLDSIISSQLIESCAQNMLLDSTDNERTHENNSMIGCLSTTNNEPNISTKLPDLCNLIAKQNLTHNQMTLSNTTNEDQSCSLNELIEKVGSSSNHDGNDAAAGQDEKNTSPTFDKKLFEAEREADDEIDLGKDNKEPNCSDEDRKREANFTYNYNKVNIWIKSNSKDDDEVDDDVEFKGARKEGAEVVVEEKVVKTSRQL